LLHDGSHVHVTVVEPQATQPGREVDRRSAQDSQSTSGPSRPLIGVLGEQVLLVWQAGHSGVACSMYYRWSGDSGQSWQEAGLLPAPFQDSCALESQFPRHAGWQHDCCWPRQDTPDRLEGRSDLTSGVHPAWKQKHKRSSAREFPPGDPDRDGSGRRDPACHRQRHGQAMSGLSPHQPPTNYPPRAAQEGAIPIHISGTPFPPRWRFLNACMHSGASGSGEIYYTVGQVRWTPAIPILISPEAHRPSLSAAVHSARLLFSPGDP
jgi:hypothetical protein